MSISFELKVTVTGSSLDEIDNGLVQAAGERIKARMVNSPAGGIGHPNFKMPEPTVTMVEKETTNDEPPTVADLSPVSSAPAAVEPAPKKRGRKPGTKFGSYKTKDDGAAQEEESESEEETAAEEVAPATTAETLAPAPAGKVPTKEETVEAIKMVNEKRDIDTARGLLSEFGVARCGDLPEEKRSAFIARCHEECA